MRTTILAAGALLLALSVATAALAQSPPPPPETSGLAVAAEAPVPVPQPSEKAMRYYRSGNVLWAVSTLWGFSVPALLLFTGFSARLRDLAQRIGRRWFFVLAIYFVLFSLVTFLLGLPLSYYTDFVRDHQYGLSNQTFGKWLGDSLKGLLVGTIVGALLIWLPYLLLRKSPRRWWLYTGLLSIPLLVLALLVGPVWIDPLFNKFGPMKDKQLEARILALADRAGIEGSRVYEVEKSVDTNAVNASVNGIGDTKRIVLWDTLLRKLDDREVLFVMGHEMGHYVLGHIRLLLVLGSALALLGLLVIHLTARRLIERYHSRFGFTELSDVASPPLIVLLMGLTFFVLSPILLAISRNNEHQSDRFGLEITHDNRAAATAFVKLQEENLNNPRPGLLFKLWRSSHPPVGERIDFCNTYRPWETGQPLAYEHLFKEKGAE